MSFPLIKTDVKTAQNIITISSAKSLNIYPNPAQTNFALSLTGELQGKTTVCLYNSSGIKVLDYRTEKESYELYREIPVLIYKMGYTR